MEPHFLLKERPAGWSQGMGQVMLADVLGLVRMGAFALACLLGFTCSSLSVSHRVSSVLHDTLHTPGWLLL